MEPFDYLRTVIARWRLVLATTLVAASIAWFTTPADAGAEKATSYTATAILVRAPGSDQSVARVAVFVTGGEVPARAAEKLGSSESPEELAHRVEVTPDDTVGTLTIAVKDSTADGAVRIADEFVAQTTAWMREQASTAADQSEQVKILRDEVDRAEANLAALDAQVNDNSGAVLQTQLAAAEDDLRTTLQRLSTARSDARAAAAPFQVVQEAVAAPDSTTGFSPPSSRLARTTLAALGGLALGIVLALLVSRIDTRLRRRSEVQAAYGLPVIGEIPNIPWWKRPSRRDTVVLDPAGPVADAYRPLRSAISLTEPVVLTPGHDVSRPVTSAVPASAPGVIAVVSARSGEGRTSVAVNLAACLAESGKRVIVIDADVQRPHAHSLLGVPASPGFTDLDTEDVAGLLRASIVPGVRLLQAGTGSGGGAPLPLVLPRVVAAARELADVVVVDCPPMLAGTEAMDVMSNADAALVVCRAGRTSREEAERVQELLARVRVPVFGVTLLGTPASGSKPAARPNRRLRRPRAEAQIVSLPTEERADSPANLTPDRVGAAEAQASAPSANADPTFATSQPSPSGRHRAASDLDAGTPHGSPRSGEPSRPAPSIVTESTVAHDDGSPHGAGNLRKQAQRKRRTSSKTGPRVVAAPRLAGVPRGDR
jgi:Mrp family chromosome partitioning ATPase/capsular polysaccharide biosynthesis protein